MREAATVLDVLRERGRRGLPLERLYRQLFNPQLYLLAYGRLYSNKGAMTPGPDGETVDGMSMAKIGRIIDALRYERYRFKPVRRVYIPKKNGKKRPLGKHSAAGGSWMIAGRPNGDRLGSVLGAHQVGTGRSGIQGRPRSASRKTVIMLRPCLAAVET